MHNITLDLGSRSYDIVIENNSIKDITKYLEKLNLGKKIFVITDDNVASLYLSKIEKSLEKSAYNFHSIILKQGEHLKSFVNLTKLCNQILSYEPDRNSTIIALGGGVIGDLSGFAASIIMRGINFIQIPTSLLAQVDSSVGGKTGINTNYGKNLIGSFYQPKLVIIDPLTVNSLSKRDFNSGYAEIVKYALIDNKDFFNYLEKNREKTKNLDTAILAEIIKICCLAKARIVAADELENQQRALLNLGHSFAHSLEKETGYSNILKHGEAVAIGLVLAMKFSEEMGFLEKEEIKKLEDHFKFFGITTNMLKIQPSWNAENLIHNMYKDKKNINGNLTLILLNAIGKAFISRNINHNKIANFIFNQLK
jgi:3-dehydroquinate synthase